MSPQQLLPFLSATLCRNKHAMRNNQVTLLPLNESTPAVSPNLYYRSRLSVSFVYDAGGKAIAARRALTGPGRMYQVISKKDCY
jgi:hypothetical protein